MIKKYDVIIIGSGPAGVSACYSLIKSGFKVAILDGAQEKIMPSGNLHLDNFSSINLTPKSSIYDLFNKNSQIFNHTYQVLKLKSPIEIVQALAKGGLSKFWHGISDYFTDSELKAVGLDDLDIKSAYQELTKLIHIRTDLPLDIHNQSIYKRSKVMKNSKTLIYQLPSAINYTKVFSIDMLNKYRNFTYLPNQIVDQVKGRTQVATVEAYSTLDLSRTKYQAKYIILAAGSINTTRILLQSLKLYNYKAQFLTKAHSVIACLHLRPLSLKQNIRKDIGQIGISSKQELDGLSQYFIQVFPFNQSSINKAARYLPLPKILTIPLLRIISSFIVFADIRFPAIVSSEKYSLIKNDHKDTLIINFKESSKENKSRQEALPQIYSLLRQLKLLPIKSGEDYLTSHYAGGVPVSTKPELLSCDSTRQLHQMKRVYIADASTWQALPAKPPTLTIMATGLKVGQIVAAKLSKKNVKISR